MLDHSTDTEIDPGEMRVLLFLISLSCAQTTEHINLEEEQVFVNPDINPLNQAPVMVKTSQYLIMHRVRIVVSVSFSRGS